MIWLTWRQLRTQVSVGFAAVTGLAIYLVLLGLSTRHAYSDGLANCATGGACNAARIAFTDRFHTTFTLLSCLLIAVPGLLGAFWGAPMVARELEDGTFRLAWTQSVTRRSWMAAKLLGVVFSGAVIAGAAAALLTWAAVPYDRVNSRFAFLAFDAQHIVPVAYAAFATTLGVAVGIMAKRLVPAIAITLALFAAVQVLVPLILRAHLVPPVRRTLTFDSATIRGRALTFDERPGIGTAFVGYTVPGAWLLHRGYLLDRTNRPADLTGCLNGSPSQHTLVRCVTRQDVHWTLTYQPASRYWAFQWIEFSGYLLGAILLAGVALWTIPRATA